MLAQNLITLAESATQVEATAPVKVYHGSPHDFDKFSFQNLGRNDPGDFGQGIYFDTDIRQAIAYIQIKQGYIYTCTLNINNPYHMDRRADIKGDTPEMQKYKTALETGGLIAGENNPLSISRKHGSNVVTHALIKAGYDAVIVNWGMSKEIVVFDPSQITIDSKEIYQPRVVSGRES